MNGSGGEATLFRLQGAPACALTPLISQLPFKLFFNCKDRGSGCLSAWRHTVMISRKLDKLRPLRIRMTQLMISGNS